MPNHPLLRRTESSDPTNIASASITGDREPVLINPRPEERSCNSAPVIFGKPRIGGNPRILTEAIGVTISSTECRQSD